MPFACPGGLFTALGTDGKPTLWVNDEGYGVANTDCGASAADQSSSIGRISEFTANGLSPTRAAAPVPARFTDYNRLTTSSPGFGGLFVQLY